MRLHLQGRRRASQGGEEGYVLLTLLLMVTLLIVAATAVVPSISFEIRRDREEEMIHRGVQYSRAIRIYYKKFGRYPAKIEDLESTNNLRFLRKRYKDPVTGQDFKLLHYGEVKMTFSAPLTGAANLNGATGGNGTSVFGQSQPSGAFGGPAANFGGQSGTLGGPGGFGAAARPGSSPDAAANTDQNQPNQPADSSSDSSSTSSSSSASPGQGQGTNSGNGFSGATFGGMPVVGVVSTSKKDGIREFNHKKKYSEWQFIYDPATDRGGLLMTPNQPPLQGSFGNQQLQPGQQGNTTGGPFGPSSTGFGNNSSGFGNNPSGFNNPSPAPNPPPTTNPQNPQ